jgi:hypothetical protein
VIYSADYKGGGKWAWDVVQCSGQCFLGGVRPGQRKAGGGGIPYFGMGGGRKAGGAEWAERPRRPVGQLG